MSSQEVVDFIQSKITQKDENGVLRPLSSIVEEVRAGALLFLQGLAQMGSLGTAASASPRGCSAEFLLTFRALGLPPARWEQHLTPGSPCPALGASGWSQCVSLLSADSPCPSPAAGSVLGSRHLRGWHRLR